MLTNGNKILSNNGTMPSIVLGKRYISYFTTNNVDDMILTMTYDKTDNFIIHYGDGNNYTLATPFIDILFNHTYSSNGYNDVIFECDVQYIKKIETILSNNGVLMTCDLSNVLKKMIQIEHLDIHNFIVAQDISLTNLPISLSYLNVNNTQLSGDLMSINLYDLLNLEFLDISYNSMSSDLTNLTLPNSIKEFYIKGNYFSGDVSNWTFPNTLEIFEIGNSNSSYSGLIDNWDFSSTNLSKLKIELVEFGGDISNWVLPNTLTDIDISYSTIGGNISNINWSNTPLNKLRLYRTNNISGLIENLVLPNTVTRIDCQINNISGNFNNFIIPSATTFLDFHDNNIDFDISNYTIPNTIETFNLSSNNIYGDITNLIFNSNIITFDVRSSNITGTISWNTPNTLLYLYLNNCPNLIVDLDNITLNNVQTFWISGISGVTGNISNLDTLNIRSIIASSLDIIGDVNFSNFDYYINDINFAYNYQLTGDVTNITNYLYLTNLSIASTNITGDVSSWINLKQHTLSLNTSQVSGSCSNWIPSIYTNNIDISNTIITGVDLLIDRVFIDRRNYTISSINFSFYNLTEIINNPTDWIKQSGSTGSYIGNIYDLSENEIENLVSGLDYDGNGINTPWSSGEQIWWLINAEKSSIDSSKRYKNFYINY